MDESLIPLAEAARILDVKRPNVRKLLRRYGLEPVTKPGEKGHPRWRREAVVGLKFVRDRDVEAREADERRRQAHLERAADPVAPPGPIGSDQGAIRPDVRGPRRPRRGRV